MDKKEKQNNKIIKPSENWKKNIKGALLFILGVIITIIITKISDQIVPNDPVFVKEYTDTLNIVHDYIVPESLNDEAIFAEFEKKLRNLELLNRYDREIKERISLSETNSVFLPNLIITHSISDLKRKGFTQGSTSSYFVSNCPTFDTNFIDIEIDFFNPEITKEIAFLRVNIYRFENLESENSRYFVLEDFYEVQPKKNFIRIYNDFAKGKYELVYGFVFKSDLNKEFPTFYLKRCIVIK
jgi:hypothetical protein